MKTLRSLTALLILLTAVFVSASFAQQKVGVINSQDVLEKSAEGKKIMARLQEADKANQTKIAALDDAIRKLQTELNTQRITMTDEAVLAKQSDLEKKNTDRKRLAEDAYSTMQDLTQRLFKRLQDELIPLVEQIAKEKSLDIVFDLGRSGAVYWNPAIDLTADLIKRYDASKATVK